MKPKGHQSQHKTDYHVDVKPRPSRTTSKVKSNAASARGTGLKTHGGKGSSKDHC